MKHRPVHSMDKDTLWGGNGGYSVIGALATAVAMTSIGVSAGWGHHRLLGITTEKVPDRVWFHVHPPHKDLWKLSPTVQFDQELHTRCAAGLRTEESLSLAVLPPPRSHHHLQSSYAGFAALIHPTKHYAVGVPLNSAPLMPWAAAGCGLIARRLPELPPGATEIDLSTTGPVDISALSGWIIGTDSGGSPVTVNLPPGSTIAITGNTRETALDFAQTIVATGRVGGADVMWVDSSKGTELLEEQWRDAWHPQSCRVVIAPQGMKFPDAYCDLIIDLSCDQLRCGKTTIPFHRLPLR